MYQTGDHVVYFAHKYSAHPGPRAKELNPERNGEGYRYSVKKYWRVLTVHDDGKLTVLTRRGKQRTIRTDDRQLRAANLWERFFEGARFPQMPSAPSNRQGNQIAIGG